MSAPRVRVQFVYSFGFSLNSECTMRVLIWTLLVLTVSAEDSPTIYYTEPNFRSTEPSPGSVTELPGGRIARGQRVLEKAKSPYLLREDLYVDKDGELIVEAGVELRFSPMIGITVRGILTADVSRLSIPDRFG